MMDTYGAIQNRIGAFFQEVDAGNWELVEQMLIDTVHLDYSSVGAGPAKDVVAIEGATFIKNLLAGYDGTHHQIGNFHIETKEQRSCARVSATVSLFIDGADGGELCTVYGIYDLSMLYQGGDWRIHFLKLERQFATGNKKLMALAADRAQKGA